jgi:hypothetical protein
VRGEGARVVGIDIPVQETGFKRTFVGHG